MIASVVVLGLGDSKLTGLATAGDYASMAAPSYQSKRAEQKAPRELSSVWNFVTNPSVRSSLSGSAQTLEYRENVFTLVPDWSNLFSLQPHTCESTRAPPLMDPPSSC